MGLCGCGSTFPRPKGETYTQCLGCQTTARLGRAGLTAADPQVAALAARITNAYAAARRRAGLDDAAAAGGLA